jgi:hypothetical protein
MILMMSGNSVEKNIDVHEKGRKERRKMCFTLAVHVMLSCEIITAFGGPVVPRKTRKIERRGEKR